MPNILATTVRTPSPHFYFYFEKNKQTKDTPTIGTRISRDGSLVRVLLVLISLQSKLSKNSFSLNLVVIKCHSPNSQRRSARTELFSFSRAQRTLSAQGSSLKLISHAISRRSWDSA